MVKKRGVGNRAEIYFDSIDLEILEFLNKANSKTREGGYSVIDIIDELKINNKSLKPHIDKLLNLGLIQTTCINYEGNEDDKKTGLTTDNVYFKYLCNLDYYMEHKDKQSYERDKKDADKINLIIGLLSEVRGMYYKEKSKEDIYIDLRSKETFEKFSKQKKPQKK